MSPRHPNTTSAKPQPDYGQVYIPYQPPAPAPAPAPWLDAKTIVALTGLVVALAGGVELRVQVGLMAQRLDRIEAELRGGRPLAYEGRP